MTAVNPRLGQPPASCSPPEYSTEARGEPGAESEQPAVGLVLDVIVVSVERERDGSADYICARFGPLQPAPSSIPSELARELLGVCPPAQFADVLALLDRLAIDGVLESF